ncbi:MAG TPA: DUF1127 domain-containing protein [Kiloniellales bacterium]|nr:DUF1127 domain-containing protein [Kiloniellales bacterium]
MTSATPPASESTPGELRRFALRLLAPVRQARRRLLLRQQLEALPDRLLLDVGIAREDLPALLRRRD